MIGTNSKNGFLTGIWGPLLWTFLHIISFNYPENPTQKDKNEYYNFIISLKYILPCKYCRENVTKNLKTIKFNKSSMKNRDTFSQAIYKLHEEVNKMLCKKSNLTYIDVKNTYENFRAKCSDNLKSTNSKIEKGCRKSLHNNISKPKCQINIIPAKSNKPSLKISKKCMTK